MQKIVKLQVSVILSSLLLLITGQVAMAQSADDLLPPEQAFAFSSEWVDNTLIARWDIADGYYMYQDKFAVESKTEGVAVGELSMTPGTPKTDQFFGEVVIYTDRAEVQIPLSAEQPVTGASLVVWGQGCNEPVGICYPPISNEVFNPLALIPAAQAQSAAVDTAPLSGLIDSLNELPSVTEDNLLPVDQAFVLDISSPDGERLTASFEVAKGYYLYQDKLGFETAGDAQLQRLDLPAGESMNDPFFGDVVIYPGDFAVDIPLVRASPNRSEIQVTATYQGCAKDLICYPPVTKTFNVVLASLVDSASASTTAIDSPPSDESSSLKELGFWWLVVSAFGTGLLLTFTPCVLPLIPILSSIVIGQGGGSRMRGGTLSIIYVLGTVAAYASVGAVAGATGDQLNAYFQNAWAIGIMSAVFVLMSLSLFGLYEIKMPSAFETRIQESSMKIGGGKFTAVFMLGILSALVVSACVSPLLISALGIAMARADPYLGAAMMTSMALGMGVILIAIGFGAGIVLPKAGPWMDRMKQGFGVMLLGVAIYLLGNLPQVPVLLLWGALFIVTGVYLGASQDLPEDAGGWKYFFKGFGIVLLIWGILCLIGGLLGSRDVMQPLAPIAALEAVFVPIV